MKVEGVVKNTSGDPIPRAKVVIAVGYNEIGMGNTTEAGKFNIITKEDSGRYINQSLTITAEKTGYKSKTVFEPYRGHTVALTIVLESEADLFARILAFLARRWLPILIVAALVLIGVLLWLFLSGEPRQECSPRAYQTLVAEEAEADRLYQVAVDCIDIAVQKGDQAGIAEATALLREASRKGHGESAFAMGRLYDPNASGDDGKAQLSPDPKLAYVWYQTAIEQGYEPAGQALEGLAPILKKRAEEGDMEADRLLRRMQSR